MSFSQKQRLFVVITSLEVNGEINFGILPNSFRYFEILFQVEFVYNLLVYI